MKAVWCISAIKMQSCSACWDFSIFVILHMPKHARSMWACTVEQDILANAISKRVTHKNYMKACLHVQIIGEMIITVPLHALSTSGVCLKLTSVMHLLHPRPTYRILQSLWTPSSLRSWRRSPSRARRHFRRTWVWGAVDGDKVNDTITCRHVSRHTTD